MHVMADFEGIPLIGEGPVGGGILTLHSAPDISKVVSLPGGVEAEVRQGVSAIVVRGIQVSGYEAAIGVIPEQANRALDILTMTAATTLALADIWSNHVVWWSTPDGSTARAWCSATMFFAAHGTVIVHSADGAPLPQDIEETPSWHESMRYFRMSETTDDLFDAFRNVTSQSGHAL